MEPIEKDQKDMNGTEINTSGEDQAKALYDEAVAKIAKMLEEAQKTSDGIIANAKKAAKSILTNAEKSSDTAPNSGEKNYSQDPYEEDKVNIFLPKDSDKYKDDKTVALNGNTYTIQRGKYINVPKAIAEILEASTRQGADATQYMEERQAEYEATLK